MKHQISIEGIKLYAYHGCLEEEAKIGGNYIVDVNLETDFSKAIASDDLSQTIDYGSIYDISKKEMSIRSKLIEEVCDRIYRSIRQTWPSIQHLRVKITKLVPPMNGDVERVSVEISD